MSDQNQSQDELLVEALYAESGIDPEQSLKSVLENDVEFERTLEQLRSTKALVDALPEVRPDPQIHYAILRAAREAVQESPPQASILDRLLSWFQAPAFAALGLFIVGGTLFAVYTNQIQEGEQAQSVIAQSERENEPKTKAVSRDVSPALAKAAAGKVAETALKQLPVVELDAPEARLGSSAVGQMELAQREPPLKPSRATKAKSTDAVAKAEPTDSDELVVGSTDRAVRVSSPRKRRLSKSKARRASKRPKPAQRVSKKARTASRLKEPSSGAVFAPPPEPADARDVPARVKRQPQVEEALALDRPQRSDLIQESAPEPEPRMEAAAEGQVAYRKSRGGSAADVALSEDEQGPKAAATNAKTSVRKGGISYWLNYLREGGPQLGDREKERAYFELAKAYRLKGDDEAAIRYLNLLLRRENPYRPRARTMLRQLKRSKVKKSKTPSPVGK